MSPDFLRERDELRGPTADSGDRDRHLAVFRFLSECGKALRAGGKPAVECKPGQPVTLRWECGPRRLALTFYDAVSVSGEGATKGRQPVAFAHLTDAYGYQGLRDWAEWLAEGASVRDPDEAP